MNIFSCHSGRAQEGTLTLGSSHSLSHGKLQVDSIGRLIGKLSLFRIWGREHTAQEVTSLGCTEGDLVRWEAGAWDSPVCIDRPESSLLCGELNITTSLNITILFKFFHMSSSPI